MTSQKSEWFACPPTLLRTVAWMSSGSVSSTASTCSTELSAWSVPASALFALSTYAWWCLSWWRRIVSSSIVGASAP